MTKLSLWVRKCIKTYQTKSLGATKQPPPTKEKGRAKMMEEEEEDSSSSSTVGTALLKLLNVLLKSESLDMNK